MYQNFTAFRSLHRDRSTIQPSVWNDSQKSRLIEAEISFPALCYHHHRLHSPDNASLPARDDDSLPYHRNIDRGQLRPRWDCRAPSEQVSHPAPPDCYYCLIACFYVLGLHGLSPVFILFVAFDTPNSFLFTRPSLPFPPLTLSSTTPGLIDISLIPSLCFSSFPPPPFVHTAHRRKRTNRSNGGDVLICKHPNYDCAIERSVTLHAYH